MFKGFLAFIMRGSVVDLAVAVVIGAAFSALVQAFVRDLLTPTIAAIVGKPDFSALSFEINKSTFRYGDFINAIISFLLVAVAIYYFVIVPMNALTTWRQRSKETPTATTRACPECLTEIPIGARRCSACTATVSPWV
jgi:large conductance mechanosensitive channel